MRPLPQAVDPSRKDFEAGSATLELVVLAPGLLLLVGLLVLGGRLAMAHNAVQGAASDAARSASIARTADQAQTGARTAAQSALAARGLQCSSETVDVDTSGFAVPVGQPADVRAEVTCRVSLSDLSLPGLALNRTVQASVTSPLDVYRER